MTDIEFVESQSEDGYAAVVVIDGEEVGEIEPPDAAHPGQGYAVIAWNGGKLGTGWSYELPPPAGYDDAKRYVREHAAEFLSMEQARGPRED